MDPYADFWRTLGLDGAPTDRKQVKRAYSAKLKLTRPEEDPDGFMRLRDAHDVALQYLAQEAAWQQEQEEAAQARVDAAAAEAIPAADAVEASAPTHTLGDLIDEADAPSPTAYATGRVQSLHASPWDAPLDTAEAEPAVPPLLDDIRALLSDPANYTQREGWNLLFRAARRLDIDDYITFENLLMDAVLDLHGYHEYERDDWHQPERRPRLFPPGIAASLFKTMSWDDVAKFNYQRSEQIAWLTRRMGLGGGHHVQTQPPRSRVEPLESPQAYNDLSKWVWPLVGGLMALAFLIDFLN